MSDYQKLTEVTSSPTLPQHGGEGTRLKGVVGASNDQTGSEGKNFDPQGFSYRGPENWTPTNQGTKNPDTIQKSAI